MGLVYQENEQDLGRDRVVYEGVPVTPNDTLLNYSAQIDAGAQPRAAQGLVVTVASSAVAITIATPGVVTWNNHGLAAGAGVVFSNTGGGLPTGITAGVTYYVVNPAANTFQIAATVGGAAINTTGSQSGTQTCSTLGTGTVALVLDNEGNTASITVAVANTVIPVSFIQVKATGTTAAAVNALFRRGG